MVLKTTGLSSRFQRSNPFWKIFNQSWDTSKNMSKLRTPNQTSIFWDNFAHISGLDEYFPKPIAALKPWAQARRFEYHEPYKPDEFFFWVIKGLQIFKLKKRASKKQKFTFSTFEAFLLYIDTTWFHMPKLKFWLSKSMTHTNSHR